VSAEVRAARRWQHRGAIAPQHLREGTRRWWRSVTSTWALEEHYVRLLTLACEAWDQAQEAREAMAAGAFIEDRFGQVRPHPALAVERDSRIAFARLVRELDLAPQWRSGQP
jgi:phage terminase small subunit